MIQKIIRLVFLLFFTIMFGQDVQPFKTGEWLRFKMSYSGFLKAGETEISLKEQDLNGKKVFHATALGKTSNVIGWFFKVRDDYQSYFDMETGQPYIFKRKINEGGYKKNKILTFDEVKKEVKIEDLKRKKEVTIPNIINVQDMISCFYFLRKYNTKEMAVGDEIALDMFFDEKKFPFKLRFLKYETLKTKFGKVKTQKFTPLVQAGRVFKENESVAIWITADVNKVPVKIKADLSVGSLRADLDAYKGLVNPFNIVTNKN